MAQKTYQRIRWENDPSVNTPLSETNLNRMDVAIDEIDNRVVDLMDGVSGSEFEGCTQSQNGKKGLVPAPTAGKQDKVLRGDGTWGDAGHASSADTATLATTATNATSASKLGNTTVGSNTKPIYLDNGTPTAVNKDLATAEQLSDGSVTKIGNSNVGDTDTPIYLHNGIPTAASFTVAKSVPADAKFTDTTYESREPVNGGTSLSLVTTGEKYLWNNKSASAGQVSYDNTESGLLAENVQDAIDELAILADADQSIVAVWEKSPAIRAHAKDTYVYYNGATYIVTAAIAIGDTLTVGTNIAVPTLEEGTVIYIPEVDGTFTADMVDYDNTTSGLSAADVQHAIDEVTEQADNTSDNIAAQETSDTASTALPVDKYFVDKDGHFRKVTSAIAQGATITNNNSTETNVGDELKGIKDYIAPMNSRIPNDITTRLANLPTAVAEQDLEKYGYKIGDYFTGPTANYTYWLADMDTFYGGYNSHAVVNIHHIGIVVDTKTNSQWYTESSISDVNYKDSTLHTFLAGTVLNNIKADMIALFGGATGLEHLVAHDKYYNGIGTFVLSGDNTRTEYISALTEMQVYSSATWSVDKYQQGEACLQLEIFRKFRWNQVVGNVQAWLRSICSSTYACSAFRHGILDRGAVTSSLRAVGLILFK